MQLYLSHGCMICAIQEYIEPKDESDIFDCIVRVVDYIDTLSENDLCRFFQPIGSSYRACSEILTAYKV